MNEHDTRYVRFDRKSVQPLHRLPSHAGRRRGPVAAPFVPRMRRIVRRRLRLAFVATIAGLVGLVALVASFLLAGPAQTIAEDTLRRMVPPTMALGLGDTRVRLAWPPSLAVRFDDAELMPLAGANAIASARRLSVRVDPFSLIAGQPRIAGMMLDGLDLNVPALRATAGSGGAVSSGKPFSLTGLPQQFDELFAVLRDWGGVHLNHDNRLAMSITDSHLELGGGLLGSRLDIVSLSGGADGSGRAHLEGAIAFDGAVSPVSAELLVPDAGSSETTSSLVVEAGAMPFPWRRLPTLFSNDMADHEPGVARAPVPTLARLELVHLEDGSTENVARLTLAPRDLSLKLAADDFVPVSGEWTFDYGFDDRIVTLVESGWSIGRSTMALSGRIRDDPGGISPPGTASVPIEFDFIANLGRLAPADSPVERLNFAARARGILEPADRLLRFTEMEMHSDAGSALAEGQMSFNAEAPSAVFQIDLDDMTVAGLKQFWPAPVARAARRWVLENLAGGRIVEGRFDIAEPLRRRIPETGERIPGDSRIMLDVEGVRFGIVGDLPPVRDAIGRVEFADQTTRMTLQSGTVYLPSGRTAEASEGVMIIQPQDAEGIVTADADVRLIGSADALGEIIAYRPIHAQSYYDYDPEDLSGQVDARVSVSIGLNAGENGPPPQWSVAMALDDVAIAKPFDGRLLSALDGTVEASVVGAELALSGAIDGLPADITMTIPFGESTLEPARAITLRLDDESRDAFAPGLDVMLRGPTSVQLEGEGGNFNVEADLTSAELILPWIGWSKGAGIGATAAFGLLLEDGTTTLDGFRLAGGPFAADGSIVLGQGGLRSARFAPLRLNEGDDVAVDIRRDGAGYVIDVQGSALDVRALVRHVRKQIVDADQEGGAGLPVTISAAIGTVRGFGGEQLRDVRADISIDAGGLSGLSITGVGASGMPFSVAIAGQGASRTVRIEALDAGELLRFADIYGQIRGGVLGIALSGGEGGRLTGPVRLSDFRVFDEPRLAQLVSSRADGSDSLRDAVGRDIDTREVVFDLAQGVTTIGPGGLSLSEGVVRGPLVGFAMQGQVRDSTGQMRMTGTFMPAYGLNSLFADIPLLGLVLGNGRDRGLIGVTFKLEGAFDSPQVTVNPLSVIAPGVFRGIFEFR